VAAQPGTIRLGDAEQFADHGDRQGSDERGDQIDRAVLGGHFVEQTVEQRMDAGHQALDRAWGERGRLQPADPAVSGRVHHGEHVGDADDRRYRHRAAGSRGRFAEQPGVAQALAVGVIAEGQPHLLAVVGHPRPGHRTLGEQAQALRIRAQVRWCRKRECGQGRGVSHGLQPLPFVA
jgi:hypothetical protein